MISACAGQQRIVKEDTPWNSGVIIHVTAISTEKNLEDGDFRSYLYPLGTDVKKHFEFKDGVVRINTAELLRRNGGSEHNLIASAIASDFEVLAFASKTSLVRISQFDTKGWSRLGEWPLE